MNTPAGMDAISLSDQFWPLFCFCMILVIGENCAVPVYGAIQMAVDITGNSGTGGVVSNSREINETKEEKKRSHNR